MFKKILIAVIGLSIIVLAYFGLNKFIPKAQPQVGNKTIYITLVDETTNETLIDKVAFTTDAETLGEFFDENHTDIKIVLGESSFARSIDEFNGLVSDISSATGPWILYSSDNNESCVMMGFCLGIDDLPIFDGDFFVFSYTSSNIFE